MKTCFLHRILKIKPEIDHKQHGNCTADRGVCLHHIVQHLLSKSKIFKCLVIVKDCINHLSLDLVLNPKYRFLHVAAQI